MKIKAIFRFIGFVLIPALIISVVVLYYIFQIPTVKYSTFKYIKNYVFNRMVRDELVTQEGGAKLKQAFDSYFQAQAKLDSSKVDKDKIEKEIEKKLKEKGLLSDISINAEAPAGEEDERTPTYRFSHNITIRADEPLTDEEVEQIVNYLTIRIQIMEECLKKNEEESQ